ncbi:sigma-54 dependent transcriptional regulator [Flavihumibacter sp. CACIAM 22H1]|uniref:sigma-54-dependent transcriptional regulator n=1 Tax=Flavihumibacter sp. CACIAM 22H1 TaxID=1812911 RepID=UPI0007A89ABC|nr:MAG: sigma-54-dependent Fis family transcriptional regulator [Flavihumibacter sp. CACIAM 22H1]
MPSLLIIDDEDKLRGLLARILRLEAYDVKEAASLQTARQLIAKEEPALIICDVKLPDGNGVEFTSWLKQHYPVIEIILLTAYGNIGDGIQAMKNGAFDYITKGEDNNKIIPLVQRAVEKNKLRIQVNELLAKVNKHYSFQSIIGKSAPILSAIAAAQRVASTNTTVLLTGETGTGKEVFAQAIHADSPRRKQSFVAINCSAFTKDLLENELFGHKAGAFTGALKDGKGLLEEADKGTLFLDEMGDMPVELQAKLLRVLESGEFYRLGDNQLRKVDIRLIAATNRDLQKEMEAGRFREDLYYRLSVFQIELPPLRERREDIPLLAVHFTKQFAAKTNKKINQVSAAYLNQITSMKWKGNIRELKNCIERSVILTDGDELDPSTLPAITETAGLDLASIEKAHILKVLQLCNQQKAETARLLGIGLTTLYRKLEDYGIH